MQIKREESGIEGVIVIREVPVQSASPGMEGTILHFTDVERGAGGFIVRAFLYNDQSTPDSLANVDGFPRDNPDYLGELHVYATSSPTVPEEERAELPSGIPQPLALDTYETFIDISVAEHRIENQSSIDIVLVLIAHGNKTVSDDHFRFAGLSVRSSRISN